MSMDFLEKNKDDIIKLYVDGMFQRDIADIYNTSSTSIGRLLRKCGFSRGKVTENDYDDVVDMYLSGVAVDDIVKKYRVSNKTIYGILKLRNVKLLDYGEHSKIYTLNEHYFDVIDTCNKAYILGLLYADGCNTEKSITLSLKSCDKHRSFCHIAKKIIIGVTNMSWLLSINIWLRNYQGWEWLKIKAWYWNFQNGLMISLSHRFLEVIWMEMVLLEGMNVELALLALSSFVKRLRNF